MTLYKPDTFHGNHEFKVGFDHYRHNAYGYWDPVLPVNYMLFTNDGEPYQFGAINHPIRPVTTPTYLGIYGTDSWTIARRLTLNLGLRYSRTAATIPATLSRGRGRLPRTSPSPTSASPGWTSRPGTAWRRACISRTT